MRIEILTLFPAMFEPVLGASIVGRARNRGLVSIATRDIRDWSTDKHRTVDDTPYGGGPGMVMRAEPVVAAMEAADAEASVRHLRVFVTPDGETWNQRLAEELAQVPALLFLCGHYEGVDHRVREHFIDREVSLGDFVLTGGELPAMVMIDSIVRLLPGALGNAESLSHESHGTSGYLDTPHYTRPPVFRGIAVPEVLQQGNHEAVAEWREMEARRRTQERRPELPYVDLHLERSLCDVPVAIGAADEQDLGARSRPKEPFFGARSFDPLASNDVDGILRRFARSVAFHNEGRVLVVSDAGTVLWDRVARQPVRLSADDWAGSIIAHNHPDGSSFSEADLTMAMQVRNAAAWKLISPVGAETSGAYYVHTLELRGRARPAQQLRDRYQALLASESERYGAAETRFGLTPGTAQKMLKRHGYHHVIQRLALEFGWNYIRQRMS